MAKCQCLKKDGALCTYNAKAGSNYCGVHNNCKKPQGPLKAKAKISPKPQAPKSPSAAVPAKPIDLGMWSAKIATESAFTGMIDPKKAYKLTKGYIFGI